MVSHVENAKDKLADDHDPLTSVSSFSSLTKQKPSLFLWWHYFFYVPSSHTSALIYFPFELAVMVFAEEVAVEVVVVVVLPAVET